MKHKISAFIAGVLIAVSVAAVAQRTGGFPSRPMFQSVTLSTGTRAGTGDLRINAGSLGIGTAPTATNGTIATESASYNDTTAPAYRATFTAGASGIFTPRATDIQIGATTAHSLLLITNGAARHTIGSTGQHTLDSGSVAGAVVIHNTNANGPYTTWSRSSTPFGDIGNAPQIGVGAVDDFAIGTRGTGDFLVATGGTIAERLRIRDAGTVLFTSEEIQQNGTNPFFALNDTDAAADNRLWLMQTTGETFILRACTDGVASCNQFLTVNRTGATVDSVEISGTAVTINGNAAAVQTSGTFTASFDTACTTTPTITYDYVQTGNVVTIYPVSQTGFTCTSDSTQFATTGAPIPAAIRPNDAVVGSIGDAFTNNGANVWAEANLTAAGNIAFHLCGTFGTATCNVTGWTASGTKGAELFRPITYMLGNP